MHTFKAPPPPAELSDRQRQPGYNWDAPELAYDWKRPDARMAQSRDEAQGSMAVIVYVLAAAAVAVPIGVGVALVMLKWAGWL